MFLKRKFNSVLNTRQTMKFLKWLAIITGSIILLLAVTAFILYWYYWGFGSDYPSGGKLSTNQAAYDISFYEINLSVDSEEESISGNTVIHLTTLSDTLSKIELDLIDNFTVEKVNVNKQQSVFKHIKHKLYIDLPDKNKNFNVVDIYYSGSPPEAKLPPWRGGFNWSEDENGNDWIGISCQGEGAKIWFPCKDHPSDEADSVALNITVPAKYFVAANGLLRDVKEENDLKTYSWFTRYPTNNYCINFGIGMYETIEKTYVGLDSTKMPVVFYVLPEALNGADSLVEQAVDMLTVYRGFYGEYPWLEEKFGLLHTDYKGMEHQTINAYGNKYHKRKIAGIEFDELMLHEMGHEWWGNKVTAADWSDFWIHEGFCTYGEALYVQEKAGMAGYHEYVKKYFHLRIRNREPIIKPFGTATEDAYSGDIYTKGAAFLHTLRYVLGDSVFFKTLKTFATDSAYILQNHVSTGDFLEFVNKNSNRDMSELFDLYLNTTDIPKVKISTTDSLNYTIEIPNIDFTIPMDIKTDQVLQRYELGPDPLTIVSKTFPVVDPQHWYLKTTLKN